MSNEFNRVLVTDDVHPLFLEGMTAAGFECDYQPAITDAAVRAVISNYVGLIVNSKIFVDKTMFDAAPHLRFVGRIGSGMEIIDRVYAAEKGVKVVSAPEGNRNAVAEQLLGMLLGLANNMTRANAEVKNFFWQREKNRGSELMSKTLGIVGFGNNGSAFAAKLLGLGMRVLVYDAYLEKGHVQKFGFPQPIMPQKCADTEGGREWFGSLATNDERWFSTYEEVDLAKIQAECDIISFHLPLNAETHHLANKDFFEGCAKPILLLNASRGKVVNTADLIAALTSGKVKGAALDVFENEKTVTYTSVEREMYAALMQFENVLVSPHVAGWTHESKQRLARLLLHKILEN